MSTTGLPTEAPSGPAKDSITAPKARTPRMIHVDDLVQVIGKRGFDSHEDGTCTRCHERRAVTGAFCQPCHTHVDGLLARRSAA
jgi:hypothetical protein